MDHVGFESPAGSAGIVIQPGHISVYSETAIFALFAAGKSWFAPVGQASASSLACRPACGKSPVGNDLPHASGSCGRFGGLSSMI